MTRGRAFLAGGLRVAALLSLLLGALAPQAHAVSCQGYENLLFCGDVTSDCEITASDALKVLRMAVGQLDPVLQADMDGSGGVTASDALSVLRIAVGALPGTFDCDEDHVVIDAEASGFVSQTGAATAGNYAVGWYKNSMVELRNWFVFDLTALDRTVTAAALRVQSAPKGYVVYGSSDPSETYTLFSVTTPVATLTAGSGGTATFDDLGAGTVYGSLVATSSSLKTIATIPLDEDVVAIANSSATRLVLGGAITTLTKGSLNEYLFNSTSAALPRQLVLTVAP